MTEQGINNNEIRSYIWSGTTGVMGMTHMNGHC